MNLLKKHLSIVALLLATLLWTSCKKEASNESIEKPWETQNSKASGVVEDDPGRVSEVPMILSADLLKKTTQEPALFATFKGKPIRSTNDVTAPTISIASPTNGTTVSGTVDIAVNASDNVGVATVSLSVDGVVVGSSSISPFTLSWNSATVTNGLHTLTVTASDAAGNKASGSIQVTVNTVSGADVTNPTVSITSPTGGTSVSGTVIVGVNAADNIGVSSVKFSVDGAIVSSKTASPYSFSWNTANVASGVRTLTATATDAAGNSSSNSIQVTINTTILAPPPTPLPSSVQLSMPPVQDQGGEGACVPFAIAYAARSAEQFYKTNASAYSYASNILSPEFLYDQTKIGDCGTGTAVTIALDFMVSTGVCTWQSMPYSSTNGCSLVPTSAQLSEAANFKIASYSKLLTSDVTAIKTMIANKHPVIITIATDQSFWAAQPGFIWKSYAGASGISHTIVISGYDDTKHAYQVMNSWGTSWGNAGFSWIDYDFLPQAATYYSYVINL